MKSGRQNKTALHYLQSRGVCCRTLLCVPSAIRRGWAEECAQIRICLRGVKSEISKELPCIICNPQCLSPNLAVRATCYQERVSRGVCSDQSLSPHMVITALSPCTLGLGSKPVMLFVAMSGIFVLLSPLALGEDTAGTGPMKRDTGGIGLDGTSLGANFAWDCKTSGHRGILNFSRSTFVFFGVMWISVLMGCDDVYSRHLHLFNQLLSSPSFILFLKLLLGTWLVFPSVQNPNVPLLRIVPSQHPLVEILT